MNKPITDVRRTIRAVLVCAVVLAVEIMVPMAIAFSGQSWSWQQARIGELMWLGVGQAGLVLLVMAGDWLVGAFRALRLRAPVLRRRYAGRYLGAGELTGLLLDAPMVGRQVAGTVCQRDRVAGSRAWRESWLAVGVDDHDLDAVLWRDAQTAVAAAARSAGPPVAARAAST